jgi:DNA-binding transcriptional ArsR family regulator
MSPDIAGQDDLFRSLGDPTRRQILDLLAEHGSLTVSEIAAHFPHLVRSGISKHLMGLREQDLVGATRQGREQHYQINAEAMQRLLQPWVAKYERFWTVRLDRLKALAEARERQSTEE